MTVLCMHVSVLIPYLLSVFPFLFLFFSFLSLFAGVTMAYVNPSLSVHKTSASAVERQREYLLDMIPSRSISQTANTWK